MKYNVGDKIRLKGTDSTGTVIDIIRNQLVIILSDGSKIVEWPENVVLIEGLVEDETVLNKWAGLKVELELSKTVIGVSNVESLRGERFMSGFVKAIIPPDGYIFKDENGNVINATKIVLEKKKKEYPKTYEECLNELDIHESVAVCGWEKEMKALQTLLVCRDAYWKIAGEKMGLGKPWEPSDSDYITGRYCIFVHQGNIICSTPAEDCPFTFPTEEMRDAFCENFKSEIEICKELL